MEKSEIKTKVISIVADKLGISKDKLTNMQELTFSDHGADSLDFVEIVMGIEDAFNIQIKDEEAEKITTVAQAAELIEKII